MYNVKYVVLLPEYFCIIVAGRLHYLPEEGNCFWIFTCCWVFWQRKKILINTGHLLPLVLHPWMGLLLLFIYLCKVGCSDIFTKWSRQSHVKPPTWRTRVSALFRVITFDLTYMRGNTSTYATAGIALRIVSLRKTDHYVKVLVPSVGRHKWCNLRYIL
jgi:hypothetical protein